MPHRRIARLQTLETAYRRGRDRKIDRIAAYLAARLTDEEGAAFRDALQRNIADGERAVYSMAERLAMARVDAVIADAPEIDQLVTELCDWRNYG